MAPQTPSRCLEGPGVLDRDDIRMRLRLYAAEHRAHRLQLEVVRAVGEATCPRPLLVKLSFLALIVIFEDDVVSSLAGRGRVPSKVKESINWPFPSLFALMAARAAR